MGKLENGFRKVAGRSQNGFSATFFQNVLQTLRKFSKKVRINVLLKLFHNQIKTLSQRCHNVFITFFATLCQTVVTTFSQRFFVTLYHNVLQTLRKLSKKARVNVLPKRFHNQIQTLSQRFHNVYLLAGQASFHIFGRSSKLSITAKSITNFIITQVSQSIF